MEISIFVGQHTACTLHTAQCTLRTVPAPANAPETVFVNFTLYIEHFALHTIHYTACCTFITSYIYTKTSKICLSNTQDLHGKMNLNITY